jgi:methylthioribose-1-phosphate isomerase
VSTIRRPRLADRSVVIEADAVRILDRRLFPFKTEWVTCRTVEEVARAIEEMVTQSSGPFFAAAGAMVLAAREAAASPPAEQLAALGLARDRLVATRRTNNHIAVATGQIIAVAAEAAAAGNDVTKAVAEAAQHAMRSYLGRSSRLGAFMAAQLVDGDSILTHCWADSLLTESLGAAIAQGKSLHVFCTETRPYLQGSRLTAESLAEMNIDTTVITDAMAAAVMSRGLVTKFITGADRVTLDCHVVNKVGTLQIALAAREFDIPYYALVHAPDRDSPSVANVPIEERDGEDVLWCNGVRTASYRVRGFYPSFDVTPPALVHAIVTDRGIFAPENAASYYHERGSAVSIASGEFES